MIDRSKARLALATTSGFAVHVSLKREAVGPCNGLKL